MRIKFTILILLISSVLFAQEDKTLSFTKDSTFSGVKFRSIGPAFMSGRIGDIAIHPEDESVWYVGVASGGVWKTTNAGTTWKPIFDQQSSYSIGCVTIDPSNPHIVWVGTGENNGGRHIGYGDGIYKSTDGGASWKNMGLKNSEHVSKIVVHPDNSDVIWVASQGPLWSKGGERGVFKSIDGGKTWKQTLGDDAWVGATDLAFDPRNPMRMYAATWQRQRTVAAYMGGGPGTGLHASDDGGETWWPLKKGLPSSNMGKIGLAISPQQPDVLYAAIELDRRTGGVYKSENRGASWEKMSDAVAGATGPHYYQELYASPHQFDHIYLADSRMQISMDGGKHFKSMNETNKHVDNHAVAFKMSDPDYALVGTDGGLYETFDGTKTWRFVGNLPLTQFYKIAVDDAQPFYNVFGGTQDNNTQGAPSRTDTRHGIRNADWFITLFGDGHQPATEPGNPDIMYCEWQQGNLMRVDRSTGEMVYIQPQPAAGEDYERYNWDAPILVSPHNPTHLYFASQRVWKSENRGDTWVPISDDLTKNLERIEQPIMDGQQGFDNPWDIYAMSNYSTITSLAESPVEAGVVYAGTDDGLLQVTENGGETWRRIKVGDLPGVPEMAFINDVKADMYDANTVYLVLDNHKYGDYKPYILKSTNRGRSWQSLRNNLPDRTLLWRLVQDHENENLLFLASEFGIYTSVNGGKHWVKMTGGLPTIPFRDLAIQKRENDLVGGSFGRGIYILDDYSFLRSATDDMLEQDAAIFPIRKAWWYIPRVVLGFNEKGSQGDAHFNAKNPEFGATFTYHLKESLETAKQVRKKQEKEDKKKNGFVVFNGWEAMETEAREEKPAIWFTIKNEAGEVVRKLKGASKKGIHRLTWNLRGASTSALKLKTEFGDAPSGMMVAPGTYTVQMSSVINGKRKKLTEPVSFEVVPMKKGALPSSAPEDVAAFWDEIGTLETKQSAISLELKNGMKRVQTMQEALARSSNEDEVLMNKLYELEQRLINLDIQLNGEKSKQRVGEKSNPTIGSRINFARMGTGYSTYGPNGAHEASLAIAANDIRQLTSGLNKILKSEIPMLEKQLKQAGAPWIEGQSLPIGE